MTFGAGYIAAERWPDFKDSAGHTAPEDKAFCARKLDQWFAYIPARNVQEHGPIYYGVVLYAIKLVADFVRFAGTGGRARMPIRTGMEQGRWLFRLSGKDSRAPAYDPIGKRAGAALNIETARREIDLVMTAPCMDIV